MFSKLARKSEARPVWQPLATPEFALCNREAYSTISDQPLDKAVVKTDTFNSSVKMSFVLTVIVQFQLSVGCGLYMSWVLLSAGMNPGFRGRS